MDLIILEESLQVLNIAVVYSDEGSLRVFSLRSLVNS
jgi:hypothetical protein